MAYSYEKSFSLSSNIWVLPYLKKIDKKDELAEGHACKLRGAIKEA